MVDHTVLTKYTTTCTKWMVLLDTNDWFIGDYTKPFIYPIQDHVEEIVNMNGRVVFSKNKSRVGRVLYDESLITGIQLCASEIDGPLP